MVRNSRLTLVLRAFVLAAGAGLLAGCASETTEETGAAGAEVQTAESFLPADCTVTNDLVVGELGLTGRGSVACTERYSFRLHVQIDQRSNGGPWQRAVYRYGENAAEAGTEITTSTNTVSCAEGVEYHVQTTVFRPGLWYPTHVLLSNPVTCAAKPIPAPER